MVWSLFYYYSLFPMTSKFAEDGFLNAAEALGDTCSAEGRAMLEVLESVSLGNQKNFEKFWSNLLLQTGHSDVSEMVKILMEGQQVIFDLWY